MSRRCTCRRPECWPCLQDDDRVIDRIVLTILVTCAIVGGLLVAPVHCEEPGVQMRALAGGQVALTADSAGVVPFGRLEVEGPIALGSASIGRAHIRLDLSGLPGETVELSSVETFRGAELVLGAYRRIGRVGDATTSVGGEWSFSTRLPHDPGPLERYPRRYGAGLRLEADRAHIAVLGGRCDWSGEPSWAWQIAGQAPLGPVVLGGDAVLSVGPPVAGAAGRDVLRLFVALDLPELIVGRR